MMMNVNLVCTAVTTIKTVSTIEAVTFVNVRLALRVQRVMIMMNVLKIHIDVTLMQIVQIPLAPINAVVNMDMKVMVLENVPTSMNAVQDTMNAHQNQLAWKILMKMMLVTVAFVIKASDIKHKNEGPQMLLIIFLRSEQTYGSCSDFTMLSILFNVEDSFCRRNQ